MRPEGEPGLGPAARIRVLVSAPYPALRAGLRAEIEDSDDLEVVGEDAGQAAGIAFEPGPIGVVVADIGDDGELASSLDRRLAGTAAVFIASTPDALRGVTLAGPAGRAWLLIESTAGELRAAIRAVREGLVVLDPAIASRMAAPSPASPGQAGEADAQLSQREIDVLRLLAGGLSNKMIATVLGISEHTVKFHVGTILSKLGASSRTEAVMIGARRGLVAL